MSPRELSRLPLLACFGLTILHTQGVQLSVSDPDENVRTPYLEPEPRRRLEVEPTHLLASLLSSDTATRLSAFRALGTSTDGGAFGTIISDARLIAVNMDRDNDFEFILVYTTGTPSATFVSIFDKGAEGWWEVGGFGCCFPWNPESAKKFVTLVEAVFAGRTDILIRGHSGGGGGVSETEVSLYRMRNGRLYRTFQTTEEHWTPGLMQHTCVMLPEGSGKERYVVMQRANRKCPDGEDNLNCTTRNVACEVYRWNAAQFRFARDIKSDSVYCVPATHNARSNAGSCQ